jgi:tyrosine-protein kinase Etk/Wzc
MKRGEDLTSSSAGYFQGAPKSAIRNRYGTIDLADQTKLLLEQSVDAQTKLLELRQKRSELDQRFTELNPAVGALDKQIATLDRQLAGFQQRIGDLPALEQQQVTLVRNLQVDTDLSECRAQAHAVRALAGSGS